MPIIIFAHEIRHASPEKRDAMIAWCKANNIDPTTVSGSHGIRVVDDQIQYHEQFCLPNGNKLLDQTDPANGNEVATMFRQVPLVEPMPDEWPRCPTCGQ